MKEEEMPAYDKLEEIWVSFGEQTGRIYGHLYEAPGRQLYHRAVVSKEDAQEALSSVNWHGHTTSEWFSKHSETIIKLLEQAAK